MAMNKLIRLLPVACLFALAAPGASLADVPDEDSDDSTRNCINVSRIRSTKVVDDRNILFYARGSTIYHNILPRRCPGLKREGRFSYRTTTGSLCQLDSIRVLYNSGIGLNEGASCTLGLFHEVTKEDAEGIIEGLPQDTEAKPLPPAEPEDVTKESNES
jgi:hypothetical protein